MGSGTFSGGAGGLIRGTSLGTAGVAQDKTQPVFDTRLRQINVPHSNRELSMSQAIFLGSTTETAISPAPPAGIWLDMVGVFIRNTSGLTPCFVTIRGYTGTTGQTLMHFEMLAPNGSVNTTFPVPLLQATTGCAWTAQLDRAGVTLGLTFSGFQS